MAPRTTVARPRTAALLTAVLTGAALLAPAAASADDPPTCMGEPATIVGTGKADVLIGTDGPDVIVAFGGDDVIRAGDGDDLICAGGGDDRVSAGPGDDIVVAGPGDDVVGGHLGDDTIYGGGGDDILSGGGGADEILGGPGADVIRGGDGDDRLYGNAGGDTLIGGKGGDDLRGGPGDDTLAGGGGGDQLLGGDGSDTLDGGGGEDLLDGGPGDDHLDGGRHPDVLDGGPGDDVLWRFYRQDTHAAEGHPDAAGDVFGYDRVTVTPKDGWVRWQPLPGAYVQGHEGVLTVTNLPDGLLMVERIDAERYLLGLGEMPFSWPQAALESQAIAARTYLASVLDAPWGPMVTYGFDICDWTLCQVYLGSKRGDGLVWEDAVVATDGQILTYGGGPAATFYHSTSGDTTRNIEDVWTSSSPLPYLQAVDVPDQGSPYEDWWYRLPLDAFLEILAADGITFPGEVEVIRTIVTEPGGGPYRMVVRTTAERREFDITTIQIALNRHALRLHGYHLPPLHHVLGQAVLSPTFTVKLRDDGDVAVRGQGWGHQIGLSQYGARALALAGSTSAEILGHFYTGLAPEPDLGFIPGLVDVGLAYDDTGRVIVLRPEDRAVVRAGPVVGVRAGGSITLTRLGDDAVGVSFGP